MRYPRLIWESENGLSAEFSVYSDDFFCNVQKDVKGLSDVTAKINTITNVGQDGETETSVYLDSRDITITGRLRTADYLSQNTLIQRLNRTLDPHNAGTLTYILGGTRRKITCRASSAPVWTKKGRRPEFSITFFCPNPYWTESGQEMKKIAGEQAGFFFPLPHFDSACNESGDDRTWPITMGRTLTDAVNRIENQSDADCGMIWIVEAKGTVVNPSIVNVDTGEYIRLNLTLSGGDVLTVTTAYGKKRIRLLHDGEESNAYRKLIFGSTFFPIYRGVNNLTVSAESGKDRLESYVNFDGQYLGVGL